MHRIIHVNGKCDNYIDSDYYWKVIEENEKPSGPDSSGDVDIELNDDEPVVYNHESKKGYEGAKEVIEIH